MTLFHSKDFFETLEFPFLGFPYLINSNERIQPHSHEFIEFVFIAEGDGIHEYRGRSYPIAEGDVFMIEIGVEHAYQVGENSKVLVYNILFDPTIITAELEALSKVTPFVDFFYVEPFLRQTVDFQSHLKLDAHERLEMKLLLDRIVKEQTNKGLGYRILIKTKLIEMFIFLSRCYEERLHKPMTSSADEIEIIQRVCEFIALHSARPLSLGQVSRLCNMSQSAFTAKFKQHVGKTFIEYRNELRIRTAQDLLTGSDDKIVHIAQKVGFDDLSFFNRVFKNSTGISPRKFRENCTGIKFNKTF